jgi:hypothetical protein
MNSRMSLTIAALATTAAAAALPALALTGAGTASAQNCTKDMPGLPPGKTFCSYDAFAVPEGATNCIMDVDVKKSQFNPGPGSMSIPSPNLTMVWCQPPPPVVNEVPAVKAGPKLTVTPVTGGLNVTVEDLTGEDADCTYTATPQPAKNPWNLPPYQKQFHLKAKGTVSWRIDGLPTGATWDVAVNCGGTRVTRDVVNF